ncbi:MAG: MBL fold metallo-hydrolase [Lachnospiraceae bacterium]|nr:MBL fold metallo-hydrolase [Lachnospiraceae bacterium]
MQLYSHKKISDRLYLVMESYNHCEPLVIGVIVGDEKVLCIDSGFGIDGKLRSYVEGLVGKDKPIIVACTHGHIDHIGGSYQFDEAYLNNGDYYQIWTATDSERRMIDIDRFSQSHEPTLQYCRDHFHPNDKCSSFQDVRDGDVFDLGGVKIRCFRIMGHAYGEISYYNEEEKYAFTGDSLLHHVGLHINDRNELMQAAIYYKRFYDAVDPQTVCYGGHGLDTATPATALAIAKGCAEVARSAVPIGEEGHGNPQPPKGWTMAPAHMFTYTCEEGTKFSYNWYLMERDPLFVVTDEI